MNEGIRDLLAFLHKKNYIGNKHCPEHWAILVAKRKIPTCEHKDFFREYKKIINLLVLIRLKKRTGKSTEWHISINPRKIREIEEMLEDDFYGQE